MSGLESAARDEPQPGEDAAASAVVEHVQRVAPTPKPAWSLSLGAILLLTIAVYLPSLSNGFTNWDDNIYVTGNRLLASPGLKAVLTTPVYGNYSPLTIWSLALNYAISRDHPASYHWLNLVLHLLNTLLVFAFIRKLSGGRFWTTVLTALFFGIHPMHVESVAWIAERKDVLYGFFYLIGLIAYLRYLDTARSGWLASTFGAFILSAASKPAAIVFPLTLIALDFFRRRPMRAAVLLEKLPFFVVSVFLGILTVQGQAALGALDRGLIYGAFARLMFACYGLSMYVVKLFVPFGLSIVYPVPLTHSGGLGLQLYATLVAVAAGVPLLLFAFRRQRAMLFGLAFFFINIVLVLQFVTVGAGVMADRFTYLPYIGLFFALAWWLDEPAQTFASTRYPKSLLTGVVLLLLATCAVQTWMRCGVWRNSETLWTDQIRKHPHRVAIAYNNRGEFYRSQGRLREALADFDEALTLNDNHAALWVNKGDALLDLNRLAPAVDCYSHAIALSPGVPYPLNKRAVAKVGLGDFLGAVADLSRSIQLEPNDPAVYHERGLAYTGLNEQEQAIADWRKVIALAPGDPDNHFFYDLIGLALGRLGRHQEAVVEFSHAIDLASANRTQLARYYVNRGASWKALGQPQRALADEESAARLVP